MTGKISVVLLCALSFAGPARAETAWALAPLRQLQEQLHAFEQRRSNEGPPLTLDAALDEALAKNPTLIALRKQFEAARLRPAQERFLMPPTFEAQIWQWPISTLNPAGTNMYMFTAGQDLPGRGPSRQARDSSCRRISRSVRTGLSTSRTAAITVW